MKKKRKNIARDLERAMEHYGKMASGASSDKSRSYFEGVAEGLNKAYHLQTGFSTLKDILT